MLSYARYFSAGSQGITDALALAATLPPPLVAGFVAGTSDQQDEWLLLASYDIDNAMKYQGRKVDTINQANEFPRIAYQSASRLGYPQSLPYFWPGTGCGDVVWDVDTSQDPPVIVVPQLVLTAVIHQANWTALGKDAELDSQHLGIKESHAGNVGKTWSAQASAAAATGLCRRAYQLMIRYQLVSGRIS